jgi:DNA-binding MarR family transcriptional regulator/GNAT superfamily N-acetyltransferase
LNVSVEARVSQLRAFNRFYSGLIGLLREGLLDTPYSLPQSRVLFELGSAGPMSPSLLARDLRLDLGYVSRLLSGLKQLGLAWTKSSPEDGRSRVVSLTPAGRRAFARLDERSSREIRQLLSRLSEDEQVRLMAAVDQVKELLGHDKVPMVVLRAPAPGDFGWVIQRHGELYEKEYAWNSDFEALVARIVADFMQGGDRGSQSAWIAEIDGNRVGCVFCMKKGRGVAQLRLLLVEPRARRMGVGGRLVDECIHFARRNGYQAIMLWTNDVLSDARRLYERAGFALVEEEPHHSFGQPLVGQYWRRELEGG